MTGPSAIGSLNGTPSSINVAPDCARLTRSFSVVARSGSPAVMKGMNPFFPSRLRFVNESAMRPKALRPQLFAHGIYVLITATRKIHDQDFIASHLSSRLDRLSYGVS